MMSEKRKRLSRSFRLTAAHINKLRTRYYEELHRVEDVRSEASSAVAYAMTDSDFADRLIAAQGALPETATEMRIALDSVYQEKHAVLSDKLKRMIAREERVHTGEAFSLLGSVFEEMRKTHRELVHSGLREQKAQRNLVTRVNTELRSAEALCM